MALINAVDLFNIGGQSIYCNHLTATEFRHLAHREVFITSMLNILITKGECTITINNKTINLSANHIVQLSPSHQFSLIHCSDDFRCEILLVTRLFIEQMYNTESIYKRVKYGVRLYQHPYFEVNQTEMDILIQRLELMQSSINRTDHIYHNELMYNTLIGFYLELGNILDSEKNRNLYPDPSRYEQKVLDFISLLTEHYRTQHKVDFYAERLNYSTHQLTRVVQRVMGQTPSDLIFDMLYSEARSLLRTSLSIQQITQKLNFSDQSAFGKFFQRHSGISPAHFRRQ